MSVTNPDRFLAKKVFGRMPQDDDELWWFVYAVWGVRLPRTRVCKNHVTPFEAFADAFFARYPVTVWKASRGFGGKTNTLALLCLTEAVALGAQSTILGGSGAQSARVHEATSEAWSSPNAPTSLLDGDPTKFDTRFKNRAWIRSLMASQTSVRGPHPQRLRLDEIDEMDLEILEAAQGQPMMKVNYLGERLKTQTVMSSTHQYPDKTMTAILKRAKEKNWPVYEWCWKETSNPNDGWLIKEEIERKRNEVTAKMWDTEYDLQEPSFEGRAIDSDAVEAVFASEMEVETDGGFKKMKTVFEGAVQEIITIERGKEHNAPRYKWPYVTAVDWAKEKDWTVVATFRTDQLPWVCVSWQRFARIPWPNMVARAEMQYARYGGKFAHDSRGVGSVVSDYLNIDKKALIDADLGTGGKRSDAFTEYISAIEAHDFLYPRIEYAYNEHKYVTQDDLFGKGHPPDSFIVGAIAWAQRPRRKAHAMELPVGLKKERGWHLPG